MFIIKRSHLNKKKSCKFKAKKRERKEFLCLQVIYYYLFTSFSSLVSTATSPEETKDCNADSTSFSKSILNRQINYIIIYIFNEDMSYYQ